MRKKETKEDSREIKENIAEKYSRVSRVISRFSKWISAWMDRILFSQRYGKLVALLLAFTNGFEIIRGHLRQMARPVKEVK